MKQILVNKSKNRDVQIYIYHKRCNRNELKKQMYTNTHKNERRPGKYKNK